ncbi:aryl-alcohol dehydrogenase-like predicted oxidoreductase [Flavobacterium arsenatis]|uniref:Aryl-alcohol dehydrogenase-like predicted oxidoreductase n=1 Tax=Flavobacterium arsenatis TaxID=1484332 RepID=A0ABU1TT29_9FLAO|nr:aldo/keto reductase [Flavobacterium arsenatis]MDR6969012.1 aryl-alcohol dehydrogenase-like predicted oxidoreductase [Flavobacterium arsenatis]
MEKRQLGNTDLQVYPIAFGGNVFGWTIDEKKSFEILNGFTHAGFNFIDTADVYSRWISGNKGGESEKIIGKWMKEKKNRHDIILTTKVGSDMGNGKKGLKKEYILKAIEDSLKRLQTDYLDLYQTHFDDLETPVEETLEAYDTLVKQGKIRWIGASNMSVKRLKESLAVSAEKGFPSYETFQPHYNLYEREAFENGLEPVCLGHNLGVITYYSLESGFLTGKYRSKDDLGKSPRGGGMEKYFNERGFRILEALDVVAKEYNTTPASVALSWLIQRPSVTAPIVSATSLSQLDSIIQAPELDLDANSIALLTANSAW